MDQYEQAVLDYICGPPYRFVNPQFTIPWDGMYGGSCPDFVALDYRDRTIYVIEVTVAASSKGLVQRVRERKARWFDPLHAQLHQLDAAFDGWKDHVTIFVREEQVDAARAWVGGDPDVSVIPLNAKVLFSWQWPWNKDNVATNPLRASELGEEVRGR